MGLFKRVKKAFDPAPGTYGDVFEGPKGDLRASLSTTPAPAIGGKRRGYPQNPTTAFTPPVHRHQWQPINSFGQSSPVGWVCDCGGFADNTVGGATPVDRPGPEVPPLKDKDLRKAAKGFIGLLADLEDDDG